MRVLEFGNNCYGSLPKKVMDGIVSVGLDAFGAGMTRREILEHVLPSDRLFLGYEDHEILGFATAKVGDVVIDLVGSAVAKRYQGNGLYKEFVVRRIAYGIEQEKSVITVRTQNPKIEMGLCKGLEELVILGLISGYHQEQTISRGLYGRKLTDDTPKCGIARIDAKYEMLDYNAGDAFAFNFNLEREK